MCNCFGVVVLHRSIMDDRRGGANLPLGRCACCYICNIVGVVVFQRSMLNWGVGLPWASVHSSLCET